MQKLAKGVAKTRNYIYHNLKLCDIEHRFVQNRFNFWKRNGIIYEQKRHNLLMEYEYIDVNLTKTQQSIQVATRQNATPDAIVATVLQNKNVVGARCFEIQNTYIVAVLTVPIYLKSERDKCKADIQTAISEIYSKETIVTFDVDVYTKIKPNMSERDKDALYKKVTARL